MDVVHLLPQELGRVNLHNVVALLPEAVVRDAAVVGSSESESIEHPHAAALMLVLLQCLEYLLVRKLLEVAQDVAHRLSALCRYHHVQVVRHKHPGINPQPLLPLAVVERLHDDAAVRRARKDVHPVDDRRGGEVEGCGEGSHGITN